MFWEVCAIVFVVLLLTAGIVALFASLYRSLRITIPYYRRKRQEYFRIVDPKHHHPSYQATRKLPTYVAPEFDSLAPDAEEDEFS